MHDGYNGLTPGQVKATLAYAIFKIFLVLGWAFLLYQNLIARTPDTTVIMRIWGAVCAFFVGFQLREAIKLWKRWWAENKELKELRESGIID